MSNARTRLKKTKKKPPCDPTEVHNCPADSPEDAARGKELLTRVEKALG